MVTSANEPLPPPSACATTPSISTDAAAATVTKRRSRLRLPERAFTECLVFICDLPRENGAGRLDGAATSLFRLMRWRQARLHSEKCRVEDQISQNSFEALLGCCPVELLEW